MNLLVDIGNSRVKWGLETRGQISGQGTVAHAQTQWQALISAAWQTLQKPQRLAVSCVANTDILTGVVQLAQQLWGKIEIIIPQSAASAFGVINAYPHPEKLGIDRWLCLIAARHFYTPPVWIVDCGTAVTVDFLDANGIHQGGLIAPGLTLMKKALWQNTTALPFSAQRYPKGLADFTEAAIFNGTLYAAVGLIECALKSRTETAMLLLTGGDADVISSYLAHPFEIEQDLVLKGLAVVGGADNF